MGTNVHDRGPWFKHQKNIANAVQNMSENGREDRTIFIPAMIGAVGATAGWVVTGSDKGMATCPASKTSASLVVPINGLVAGDVITSFGITGQIESAGGAVALSSSLVVSVSVASGSTSATLVSNTTVAATADTAFAQSKDLATAHTVVSGNTYYALISANTAASTDIELLGIEVTIA